MLNGFLNVYKVKGMTSAVVVARVKRILRQKGVEFDKIGHMGTLDPDGEGILPIALGRATRLFDYTLDKKKVYYTEFVFGKETDTLDESGRVLLENGIIPTEEQIKAIIPSLCGEIDQIPPLYSAKSVDGRRAYDLAREGKTFELKPRRVVIDRIEYVGEKDGAFAFRITCGGGTYIRSIARDMAYALGTVGYMRYIRREVSGKFDLSTAKTLEELESSNVLDCLIGVEDVLVDFPQYIVPNGAERLVLNGVKMKLGGMPQGNFKVYVDGMLVGIAEKDSEGRIIIKTRLQ
ncbi:MAG: tRNA pseudouridine(55) synthase TruB [Clostridia bacterium]|nr:tRNA pseudouridine(55) synthase TruB [Clostridia bacterium]